MCIRDRYGVLPRCFMQQEVRACFGGLLVLCLGAQYLSGTLSSLKSAEASKHENFGSFQKRYLLAYLCAVFADWLKGPYIYVIYQSCGFDKTQIATLFMAGYVSSALFGTIIGSFADVLGRRRMCLAFSVLYGIHALMHLVNDFYVLLIARLISGVATSLLFSAFESWMIAAHHARGYPKLLLSNTFAWCSMGTSFSAIIAGLVADCVASQSGVLGPMMATLPFLGVAFAVPWLCWDENHGDASLGVVNMLAQGASTIRSTPRVALLGVMQLLFEGSMHVFIFSWTPQFQQVQGVDKAELPLGEIFACFMGALMLGSVLYKQMLKDSVSGRGAGGYVFLAAAICFVSAANSQSFSVTFISFVGFEVCCGLYFPMVGTIRSQQLPEESRAAVMSLFRLPMNMVVVGVLLWSSSWPTRQVFWVCAACQICAFFAYHIFCALPAKLETEPAPKSSVEESKEEQDEEEEEEVPNRDR
eukprot:TRINITY_DN39124_c0_g2_i1.p1 TRINITY_DN39124_c0_g2~~TRINITY_DN39124_c0_g2_i1.p1  ORF type:complete len:473 (+),score=78.07 TRINITY_DN39124_c0_g2_i1:157-1575(+)